MGAFKEKSGYNFPSVNFISMGVENLVGLRCHGGFCKGVIFQGHKKVVAKVIIDLLIPIIGRVRTIWGEVFLKIIVSFDELVSSNNVFLESSHRIYTHLGVVVEVIEFQRSVTFEFCIDE